MSKRIYNRVMQENDICPEGELLTDRELEKLQLYIRRRDYPVTAKVQVKAGECYFFFGVRFAEHYKLLNDK